MTALQIQWEYFEHARKYVEREDDTPEQREVLAALGGGARCPGDDPVLAPSASSIGWRSIVCSRRYRDRDGLEWADPKLHAIDLQYHDVRRDRGLYYRLEAAGKVERLTTDEEVDDAIMEPPEDTRAYFRGRCISRFPDAIAAASWDSLIVDIGADALQRIPMREPLRGTKQHVEDLLAQAEDAASLVRMLAG